MNLNNHHLNSCQTLTIDNCNFLQLIEKEEKRLDLEWQDTYREITRIESLINSYTAHKLNLLAKLDTIEIKKSECVKRKTKLIGEMSCLPLPIDDFTGIHRFNSDDDLQNSSLCLRENGSESGSNSFSMDNIVADLLQTISEGTGVSGNGGGSVGCGSSSLGSSTGNGTYERPESSSSVTFSSGSSDYPATVGRISSPQSSMTLTSSTNNNNNNNININNTTGLDHHSNHHLHQRNQNFNNNNNNINSNNNNNNIHHHPGMKPVTAASIVSNISGSNSNISTNSNTSSISSSGKTNNNINNNNNNININGHLNINNMNNNNNNNLVNDNTEIEESSSTGSNGASSQVVGPPPRFTSNRSFNTHKVQYNSVLTLETSSNGYVYKSLNDGTVMRYKFGNPSDNQIFPGHKDKVKVLVLDSKSQLLYTGCDDGNVRCFNAATGQLCNQFSCDGIVISIDRSVDEYLVFATNKGWIYLVNHNFKLISSHRTFNWIFAVRNILQPFKDGSKRLLVIPMKHKPTVVEAISGKILQEIGTVTIESRPCLQVNGSIAILASVADKSDNGTSHINVYDSASNWKCIQLIKKEGLISSMCTHGHDLYVGIKFPSYGHVQCFKWSNRSLYLKWVACIAYVHTLSVMPSDVHNLSLMPSDIVLNGGPDGNVYNTTPNAKGPFFCMNKKCDCKLPFARRKDLDFHYSKLQSSS